MNKYLKFLTFSIAIFWGGTALNSNVCYGMEDISEYEINTSSNTTNNVPQQQNIPAQNVSEQNNQGQNNPINNINNNYNQAELIKTLQKLFTTTIWIDNDNRNNIVQEIRNCIENIKEFYKSNDINTLRQLTQLVHNTINNSWRLKTNMIDNINELQKEKVIKNTDCEELLKFNLFLNIMTNIENKDKKAWTHKSDYKWSLMDHPVIIDGKTWYVNKYNIKGEPYETLLENETESIIQKFTEVLINKYFVLNNPNTWIPKDKLVSKIEKDIKDTCQCIDELQITKQMLNNKDNQSNFDCYSILDNISYVNVRISDTIDNFFDNKKVENILVEKLTEVFRDLKIKRMYRKSNAKSKSLMQNIINYTGDNSISFDDLAEYQALPEGLFNDPNGIPAIVLSYLYDKLADKHTYILPRFIIEYMKKCHVVPEWDESSSEEDNNGRDNSSDSDDDRD